MIDIPVRAKDALREGVLKKNYIFSVYKYMSGYALKDTIDNTGGYSVESNADIKVRCDEAFDVSITFNGVTTTNSAILDDDGTYYYDIVSPDIGSLLQVSNGTVSVYVYTDADWLLYDTIDNNTLVKESVKIDERMCSGSQLKFGLCEGAALEFQYFNHDNINGMQIYAVVSVQYYDENGDEQWEAIPMGWFEVVQCPMQFSTGIRKVTAYNKLRSAYLDEKANAYLNDIFTGDIQVAYIQDIINSLLNNYGIVPYETRVRKISNYPGAQYRDVGTTRFKQVYGEHILNGTLFWDSGENITTSTDLNMRVVVGAGFVNFTNSNDNYIQIRVPDFFDDLDDNLYDLIYDTVYDCFSSTTAANFMNDLINYESGSAYIKKWMFGFRVIFHDDTEVYYGSALTKQGIGSGTFAELNRITLHNVKQIIFTQFHWITFNVNGYSPYSNNLYCAGSKTQSFRWSSAKPADASQIYTSTYNIPVPEGMETIPAFTEIGGRDYIGIYELLGFSGIQTEMVDVSTLADVTLRELQSAVYEMNCQYGQISRTTNLFSGITLNNSRLLPADDLYPDNGLYPNGNSLSGNPSMYSKLWTDSQGVQSFKYLIITYKTLDANNQEVEKTLQRTVNADGTTNYNCSDNWLFRNLVWTEADVGTYADAMVLKMKGVTWFPFEMWCAGLPYIEIGDEIEITNSEGTFTSYVLQRQLNGIQNLQDTYINGELDVF